MSTTPTPTCHGPRITAYVDGVLPPEARAEVEAHLRSCPSCREQEAFERGLRERMRELSAPEVPPGLEDRVRRRIRRRPLSPAVRWLPLAAGIALALLWGRGAAPFVAWEIARDHIHCFGKEHLPAQVWTSDTGEIAEWYRQRHLYYAGEKRHLSLYVVPGPARFGNRLLTRKQGENVRLLHTGGVTLAVVSEDADLADAFQRALSTRRADASGLFPLPCRAAR
ncbi:MAG: hypothetical protein DMF77_12750 [Acidobacteria bacterium]|nr:MAG: hypothetical protein DMF77_12750 [Acidobacteriota bacterium]